MTELVPINGVFRFNRPNSSRYDVIMRLIDTKHAVMVFSLVTGYDHPVNEVFALNELDPLGDVTPLTEDEMLVLQMTYMLRGG